MRCRAEDPDPMIPECVRIRGQQLGRMGITDRRFWGCGFVSGRAPMRHAAVTRNAR